MIRTYAPAHWLYFVTCRWLWRTLFTLLGPLEVRGLERLPGQGPMILAPTHKSILDPWLVLAACPIPFRSLAGRDLFEIPVLGWYLRSMGAFPITRGQADLEAMAVTRAWLEKGATVLIFPEGRCSPDENLLPLYSGVAVLALRAGASIVPVGIRGSNRMLPLGAKRPRRHRVSVEFGEPIAPPRRERNVKRQVAELLEQLRTALEQLSR